MEADKTTATRRRSRCEGAARLERISPIAHTGSVSRTGAREEEESEKAFEEDVRATGTWSSASRRTRIGGTAGGGLRQLGKYEEPSVFEGGGEKGPDDDAMFTSGGWRTKSWRRPRVRRGFKRAPKSTRTSPPATRSKSEVGTRTARGVPQAAGEARKERGGRPPQQREPNENLNANAAPPPPTPSPFTMRD